MLLKHFEYKFCLLDIKYKHVDNLYDSSFGHDINYKYLKNNIDNINKYKIILPIRNPIDRIISWIKYNIMRVEKFLNNNDDILDESWFKEIYKYDNLKNHFFIYYYYKTKNINYIIHNTNMWKIHSQNSYVIGSNKVDYIIRTENIVDDLKIISNDFCIQNVTKKYNKTVYDINLDEKSIELIKNYYKDDYDFFEFDTDNYNLNTIEYLNFINSKLI